MIYAAKTILETIDDISYFVGRLHGTDEANLDILEHITTATSLNYISPKTVEEAKKALINKSLVDSALTLLRQDLLDLVKVKREQFITIYENDKKIISGDLLDKYNEAKSILEKGIALNEHQFEVVKSRLINKFRYWDINFKSLKHITRLKNTAYIMVKDRNELMTKHIDLVIQDNKLSNEHKDFIQKHIMLHKEQMDVGNLDIESEDLSVQQDDNTLTYEEFLELVKLFRDEEFYIINDFKNGTVFKTTDEIYSKILAILDLVIDIISNPTNKYSYENLIYDTYKAIDDRGICLASQTRSAVCYVENLSKFTSAYKQYL